MFPRFSNLSLNLSSWASVERNGIWLNSQKKSMVNVSYKMNSNLLEKFIRGKITSEKSLTVWTFRFKCSYLANYLAILGEWNDFRCHETQCDAHSWSFHFFANVTIRIKVELRIRIGIKLTNAPLSSWNRCKRKVKVKTAKI